MLHLKFERIHSKKKGVNYTDFVIFSLTLSTLPSHYESIRLFAIA
jgi:hypothetical protein